MSNDESALDITLADDALDDDCTRPEGCTHESAGQTFGNVQCHPDCPFHGVVSRNWPIQVRLGQLIVSRRA